MKQTNRLGFMTKLSRFAYLSPPEWQIPTSLDPNSLDPEQILLDC